MARLSRPLGQQLAELPLDPRLGAACIAAGRLGCAAELATIAALLSVQVVWAGAQGERRALEAAKAKSGSPSPAPLTSPHHDSHLPTGACEGFVYGVPSRYERLQSMLTGLALLACMHACMERFVG